MKSSSSFRKSFFIFIAKEPLMKFVIFFFLIAQSIILTAQSLEEKYRQDVCICIDNYVAEGTVNKDNFLKCFEDALTLNKDSINSRVYAEYGDTSYISGYEFGQSFSRNAMVKLIQTCDSYFYLMDSLRDSSLKELDQDSLKRELMEMNKVDHIEKGVDYYAKRGLLYFQMKNYKDAITDLDMAITLSEEPIVSNFVKPWALEKLGNYEQAMELYMEFAVSTGNQNFMIFAAIAERKLKSKSNRD